MFLLESDFRIPLQEESRRSLVSNKTKGERGGGFSRGSQGTEKSISSQEKLCLFDRNASTENFTVCFGFFGRFWFDFPPHFLFRIFPRRVVGFSSSNVIWRTLFDFVEIYRSDTLSATDCDVVMLLSAPMRRSISLDTARRRYRSRWG